MSALIKTKTTLKLTGKHHKSSTSTVKKSTLSFISLIWTKMLHKVLLKILHKFYGCTGRFLYIFVLYINYIAVQSLSTRKVLQPHFTEF